MSLAAVARKLIKHGLTITYQAYKGKPASHQLGKTINNLVKSIEHTLTVAPQKNEIVRNNIYTTLKNFGAQCSQRVRCVLKDTVLNEVAFNRGTEQFQKISYKRFYGNSAPLLSLVGVAVVGQGLMTKEEELEGVCWEIRKCITKIHWNRNIVSQETSTITPLINLESLTFGEPIGKGSNAVVYSVKLSQEGNDLRKIDDFPLALKMMFNYDIQSNSIAILKAMYRETVPASVDVISHGIAENEYNFLNMTRHLPSHPNIVKIFSVFTDFIPELEKCRDLYPAALPKRIHPEGEGRNLSLFILMPRYHQNLKEFINTMPRHHSTRTCVFIMSQLLEATTHLVAHNIVHRDIKADNILLDSSEPNTPLAVISDFGCCLAETSNTLVMPYPTFDVDKGGNAALMAPEIITKKPGPFSKLNYQKSDLWAIGAIGYEIFGVENPFYGDKSTRLSSMTYEDIDLPPLPETVPPVLNRLIRNLLRREPGERLHPALAANVCQLFLWAPTQWLSIDCKLPSYQEILYWLLDLAAKIVCEENKLTYVEYLLISTFLYRVRLKDVRTALSWIREETN